MPTIDIEYQELEQLIGKNGLVKHLETRKIQRLSKGSMNIWLLLKAKSKITILEREGSQY